VAYGVNYNIEGSIFRRMKRIFTSFHLIDAYAYRNDSTITVTDFGRRLSAGLIDKHSFYAELILIYQYPHPAYSDNTMQWNSLTPFKPMLFIAETLKHLESPPSPSYRGVRTKEFATLVYPKVPGISAEDAASILKNQYQNPKDLHHSRLDAVDRKISDLFGFLVMIELLEKREHTFTRFNSKSQVASCLGLI